MNKTYKIMIIAITCLFLQMSFAMTAIKKAIYCPQSIKCSDTACDIASNWQIISNNITHGVYIFHTATVANVENDGYVNCLYASEDNQSSIIIQPNNIKLYGANSYYSQSTAWKNSIKEGFTAGIQICGASGNVLSTECPFTTTNNIQRRVG